MFDFTHKKRPDLIQLVLIIAIACLALGAIVPSASAVEYEDLTYGSWSSVGEDVVVDYSGGGYGIYTFQNFIGSYSMVTGSVTWIGYVPSGSRATLEELSIDGGAWRGRPSTSEACSVSLYYELYCPPSEADSMVQLLANYILNNTNLTIDHVYVRYLYDSTVRFDFVPNTLVVEYSSSLVGFDGLTSSLTAFAPDDPHGMYVLSLDGSYLDTTYTVGINRYTDEFKYLIDSYAYTDGSGGYTFTGSRSLTLPIYYNSFTNMPYSYEVSINVNDENGYLDERYLVYWSDLGGLYDSAPAPVLPTPIPTPTQTFVPILPVNPSDIIPDPESLNDTINITGWYQDSGFEGNNITAPIYSGIRGWFNENLVPVIDFFLTPTNYVATVISDSAETSTDGISYITEELGSYAAPFNTVGAYVVRLVPEVVWLVVFAALSIGYVILLIRISTGSIKDTIGRFLGGSK